MALWKLVPTSWLDPLLTGDKKVLPEGGGPYTGPDVERLLLAIRDRIKEAEGADDDE